MNVVWSANQVFSSNGSAGPFPVEGKVVALLIKKNDLGANGTSTIQFTLERHMDGAARGSSLGPIVATTSPSGLASVPPIPLELAPGESVQVSWVYTSGTSTVDLTVVLVEFSDAIDMLSSGIGERPLIEERPRYVAFGESFVPGFWKSINWYLGNDANAPLPVVTSNGLDFSHTPPTQPSTSNNWAWLKGGWLSKPQDLEAEFVMDFGATVAGALGGSNGIRRFMSFYETQTGNVNIGFRTSVDSTYLQAYVKTSNTIKLQEPILTAPIQPGRIYHCKFTVSESKLAWYVDDMVNPAFTYELGAMTPPFIDLLTNERPLRWIFEVVNDGDNTQVNWRIHCFKITSTDPLDANPWRPAKKFAFSSFPSNGYTPGVSNDSIFLMRMQFITSAQVMRLKRLAVSTMSVANTGAPSGVAMVFGFPFGTFNPVTQGMVYQDNLKYPNIKEVNTWSVNVVVAYQFNQGSASAVPVADYCWSAVNSTTIAGNTSAPKCENPQHYEVIDPEDPDSHFLLQRNDGFSVFALNPSNTSMRYMVAFEWEEGGYAT